MRRVFLIAGLLVGMAGTTQAHVGERVIPIYELSDEDLVRIDLKDGSVEEWEDIIGDPQLTAFSVSTDPNSPEDQYDPSDFDFRIWIGWNQSTSRIYVVFESIDDDYFNEWEGINGSSNFTTYYDSFGLKIDGDHSGGQYNYGASQSGFGDEGLSAEEKRQIWQVKAQSYFAIAETPDDRYVNLGRLDEWASSPPYIEGKGSLLGASPTISVIELFVTPFDRLVREEPEESVTSQLFPGKVIGFSVEVHDVDTPPGVSSTYSLTSGLSIFTSDLFVDGVLVGKDGKVPEITAVEQTSWARIKAVLGK